MRNEDIDHSKHKRNFTTQKKPIENRVFTFPTFLAVNKKTVRVGEKTVRVRRCGWSTQTVRVGKIRHQPCNEPRRFILPGPPNLPFPHPCLSPVLCMDHYYLSGYLRSSHYQFTTTKKLAAISLGL